MARGRQIIRQWKVLRALEQSHQGLTVADLRGVVADPEPSSERTLYRDLEHLQAAGFPLEQRDGRWRVLRQGEGGFVMPIEPSEVLALSLIDDLLAPIAGSYLADPLEELRGKLTAMLTPEGRAFLVELRQTAVATLFGPAQLGERGAALAAIGDAIGRQHRLRIRYAKPGASPEPRTVDPYATWYAAGRVYLIAYCHVARDVRTFAVPRIVGAEVLDEAFEPVAGFDPSAFSRLGFGVYHGAVAQVVIDFGPAVAHLLRERRYHETQRVEGRADGGVRLRFEAAGLPEIAAWVAGFGGHAVVVDPPELVEAVRALHQAALAAIERGAPSALAPAD
jgi:predicted DNA-binding transcriptional regulator YafY